MKMLPGKDYSAKRGDSIYPLHEGAVVRLKAPVNRKRWDISKSEPDVEHIKFFWLQHISTRQPGHYQERMTRVMVVLVPTDPARAKRRLIYELTEGKRVQLETTKKWMRDYGYEHLGDIPFRQRHLDYGKFYEMIGITRSAHTPVVKEPHRFTSPPLPTE